MPQNELKTNLVLFTFEMKFRQSYSKSLNKRPRGRVNESLGGAALLNRLDVFGGPRY